MSANDLESLQEIVHWLSQPCIREDLEGARRDIAEGRSTTGMTYAVNSGCRRSERVTAPRACAVDSYGYGSCAEWVPAAAVIVEFVAGALTGSPYVLSKPLTNELLGLRAAWG